MSNISFLRVCFVTFYKVLHSKVSQMQSLEDINLAERSLADRQKSSIQTKVLQTDKNYADRQKSKRQTKVLQTDKSLADSQKSCRQTKVL